MSDATDLANKVMEAADKIGAKMEALAIQYGPTVVDAGLAVARIDAAHSIVRDAVCLSVSLFLLLWACPKLWRWGDTVNSFYHPECRLPAILIAIFSAVTAFVSAISLASLWLWVGLFKPELYLAAKILKL